RLGERDQDLVVRVRHAGIVLQLAVEGVEEDLGRLDIGAPRSLLVGAEPARPAHAPSLVVRSSTAAPSAAQLLRPVMASQARSMTQGTWLNSQLASTTLAGSPEGGCIMAIHRLNHAVLYVRD